MYEKLTALRHMAFTTIYIGGGHLILKKMNIKTVMEKGEGGFGFQIDDLALDIIESLHPSGLKTLEEIRPNMKWVRTAAGMAITNSLFCIND